MAYLWNCKAFVILYIDFVSSSPDIVIIGAGLIGLSCADSLVDAGLSVMVLDWRPGVGEGTSFSNSGMLHPSQSRPWSLLGLNLKDRHSAAEAVLDLARKSVPLIRKNSADLGLSRMQSEQGCYKIFETETALSEALTFYTEIGINTEQRPLVGAILNKPTLYFPEDSFGDAHIYCQALARRLIIQGVDLKLGIQNASIITNKDRVEGVQIVGQMIATHDVIVAAGARSPDLVKPLGLDLPIKPVIGHALDFNRPANKDFTWPDCPVMDAASHSALTPFENHIRLSGTIDQDSPDALIDIWQKIAPRMIDHLSAPDRSWSAPRPMSAMGRPIISMSPVPGLWINTGHGHMGWTLSAGSGALMAQMITSSHTDIRYHLP